MGRAVFAETDRIVSKNIDGSQAHHSSQANGWPHIIRENQEGTAIRDQTRGMGQTVENRAHGMLAYSEMDVAAAGSRSKSRLSLQGGIIRWCQVGRTAQQQRQVRRQGVKHQPTGLAGRHRSASRIEYRQPLLPII